MKKAESSLLSSTNKMSTVLLVMVSQGKIESRAVVHSGLGPNATAVSLDNPVNNRQSHARAIKLIGAMKPLENMKQFVGISHLKPGPVVLHEINRLVLNLEPTDFDHSGVAVARILQRVGKKFAKTCRNNVASASQDGSS